MEIITDTPQATWSSRTDRFFNKEIRLKTLLSIFLGYVILSRLRFSPYRFNTLAGDDLYMFAESNRENGMLSTFLPSIFDHGSGKWRPLPQVILSLLLDLFSADFWKYQLLNETLLALTALLTVLLIARFSGRITIVAVIAGLIPIVSNFNLYYVLQVLGLMEFCALLSLMSAIFVLANLRLNLTIKAVVISNIFYFLSIHSHERYILACGSVILLTFFRLKEITFFRRTVFSSFPLISICINYVMKVFIFEMNFLTGAGGTEINSTTLDIPHFFWDAVRNVFGYNVGPDYLSSKDATSLGITSILLSLSWALPSLFVVVRAGIAVALHSRRQFFITVIIVVGTLFPLLLTASISFRQEFRWLFSAQIALVVIVAVASQHVMKRYKAVGFLSIFAFLALVTNGIYYAQYSENTYFFRTQSLNDSAYQSIFLEHIDQIDQISFVIVTGDDPTYFWGTASGQFYREYARSLGFEDLIEVQQIADLSQIGAIESDRPIQVVMRYSGSQLVQVP